MEPKRRILLAHLALTLLAAGAGLYYFAAQLHATRIATGPLVAAIGFAALACGLGGAAIVRIARATPEELGFLGARYLRIAFSAALIVFTIVLFGTQKEAGARLGAHLFGLMALHRLALLFPARLSAALDAIGRRPVLRGAELAIFNLCATVFLTEGVLRAYYLGSGQGFFRPQYETPFKRKLTVSLFGSPPNSLGYNDDEFERARRPGIRRIAAIGDSFFVAPVPRPDGVIARVETLLAERGAHAEVYNFGILASDIDDYLFVLEHEALSFQPDLVLVGIYVGNDLRIARVKANLDHKAFALDRAVTDIRRRVAALWLQHTGEFRDVTSAPAAAADLELPVATRERYLQSIRREIAYFAPTPAVRSSARGSTRSRRSTGSSRCAASTACRSRWSCSLRIRRFRARSARRARAARGSIRPRSTSRSHSGGSPRSLPSAAFRRSTCSPPSSAPRATTTRTASTSTTTRTGAWPETRSPPGSSRDSWPISSRRSVSRSRRA
jgi:hypothetical protein